MNDDVAGVIARVLTCDRCGLGDDKPSPVPPFVLESEKYTGLAVVGECPNTPTTGHRLSFTDGDLWARYAHTQEDFILSQFYKRMRYLLGEHHSKGVLWMNASCCRHKISRNLATERLNCTPHLESAVAEWGVRVVILAGKSAAEQRHVFTEAEAVIEIPHPSFIFRFHNSSVSKTAMSLQSALDGMFDSLMNSIKEELR